MRLIFSLLMVFFISFQSIASVQAHDFENIGRSYKNPTRRIGPTLYKTGGSVAKTTTESISHHGQALLLIMLLTGVDLVKQSLQLAQIRKQSIDHTALLEYSTEAAEHILKSGHVWSSMFGAGVTTTVMSKPLAIFQSIIQNSNSYPIFKNLLSNGIATLVLFVGWELGGQLFTEAREMLEDEDDYKRAEDLMPVLINSIKYGTGATSSQNKSDWKILQKVYNNVIEILISNHDLRNLWLYNTFRLRIASGEFTTLVASMVSATAAGTAIFPGAGTIGGMIFGLTGGVLSLYIPEEQKNNITDHMRNLRIVFWKAGRDGYENPVMAYHETVFRILSEKMSTGEALPPLLKFSNNPKSMNEIMTATFEKAYIYDSRLQSALAMRSEAVKYKNTESIQKWTKTIQDLQKKYLDLLEDLSMSYRNDLEYFDSLLIKYNLKEKLLDPNYLQKYPMLMQIRNQQMTLISLNNFFTNTLVPAIRAEMLQEINRKTYFRALQKFYILGFDQQEIIRLTQ